MKKTLNVLGIIAAWLLSIVLVVMLIVTPIVFSALSLLNAKTITKVVTDTFTAGQDSQPSAESAEIVTLSNTTQSAVAEDAGKDLLTDMFGDSITQEQIGAIMSSKAMKELVKTYAGDLTNAITGGNQQAQFNAEKLKSIVNDNIDDIVKVLQTNIPECANMDAAELKSNLLKAINENAEQIVSALPKPEEIKEQMVKNNPALETALNILAMKNTIKMVMIGVIVVLSGLIFACRIPGLRGFRWLAVNLFVGGGINAFTTVGLLISQSAVSEIAKNAGAQVAGMIGALLSSFTGGMLVRTLVMLAFGGVLLTAYILLRKLKEKKLAATLPAEEMPAAEWASEEVPAEQVQA